MIPRSLSLPFALLALAGGARAQQFVNNTADIPQGNPFNNSRTENVDFADIDLDGDWDAAFADGGDGGNDQNRLWRNMGPGANLGKFVDETATRLPAVTDTSRDIEFVDFDNDGDSDIYVSNTSAVVNQSNRWWRNTGVGNGVYVDETAMRWVNLGVNDGVTTFSSVPASAVLASGGFIDWSCDCDFGDLDNDGDMDLVHSSYGGAFGGQVPTRIFLNDGAGFFEEFNPSHFQLSGTIIHDGDPAIWAEGVQMANTTKSDGTETDVANTPLDIDIADLDGDLDLDILHGARNEVPRLYFNRLEESGGTLVAFHDATYSNMANHATGGGNYEQELGDVDNDGDIDIYGLNWSGFSDIISKNDGTGNFGPFAVLPGSGSDDNEGDFLDFDQDGDLDLFVANFSGQDRLYRNVGNASGTYVLDTFPSSTLTALDADCADVDNDGDTDIFVANDGGQPNRYFENVTQVADTTAPTLFRLEQAPNRTAGGAPTVVRVQVYDNLPYYGTWYDPTRLEVSVNGGPPVSYPMMSSGGQIFRGEIPGNLVGTICYQAFSSDHYGNEGSSGTLCYTASGTPGGTVYCTAKASSAGCVTSIAATSIGDPVSGASDYSVAASNVQGFKNGLLFAGITGPSNIPFSGGILCVNPPNKRGPVMNAGGSSPVACDGAYTLLVNTGAIIPTGMDAGPGNSGWYQWWYRDPANGTGTLGTALSDAIRLDFQ